MARVFRQPLGVRAACGAGGQGWALVRQLAAWSAYGWGFPALLTALAVSMYLRRARVQAMGFAPPTFFETRTCLLEGSKDLGAMFYYYIPMSILVVVNGACLAFTFISIRKMKKETAVVQNMGSSTGATNGSLQNALLYVKLLLTAGAAELLLEMSTWGSRTFKKHEEHTARSYDSLWQSIYLFNIVETGLDVVRATAVLWLSARRWAWAARAARAVRRALQGLLGRGRGRRHAQEPSRTRGGEKDSASVDSTTTTTINDTPC